MPVVHDGVSGGALFLVFCGVVMSLWQICASPAIVQDTRGLKYRMINFLSVFFLFIMTMFCMIHFHSPYNHLAVVLVVVVRAGTGLILSIGGYNFLKSALDTLYRKNSRENRGTKTRRKLLGKDSALLPIYLTRAVLYVTLLHALACVVLVLTAFAAADQIYLQMYYIFVSIYALSLAVIVLCALVDVLLHLTEALGSLGKARDALEQRRNTDGIVKKQPSTVGASVFSSPKPSSSKPSASSKHMDGGSTGNGQHVVASSGSADIESTPSSSSIRAVGTNATDTYISLKKTQTKLRILCAGIILFVFFEIYQTVSRVMSLKQKKFYSPLFNTVSFCSLIGFYGALLSILALWTWTPLACKRKDELTICYVCCLSGAELAGADAFAETNDTEMLGVGIGANEDGKEHAHDKEVNEMLKAVGIVGATVKAKSGDQPTNSGATDSKKMGILEKMTVALKTGMEREETAEMTVTAFPDAISKTHKHGPALVCGPNGASLTKVVIINCEAMFEDRRIFRKSVLEPSLNIFKFADSLIVKHVGGEHYVEELEEALNRWSLHSVLFLYHPTVNSRIISDLATRLQVSHCFAGAVHKICRQATDDGRQKYGGLRIYGQKQVAARGTSIAAKAATRRTVAATLKADDSGMSLQALVLDIVSTLGVSHDEVLYVDYDKHLLSFALSINLCRTVRVKSKKTSDSKKAAALAVHSSDDGMLRWFLQTVDKQIVTELDIEEHK